MQIEDWIPVEEQMCTLGYNRWSVARLFELSKNLTVMEIPIGHLNIYHTYDKLTLRNMVTHLNAIVKADLSFPIILDEDGEIMDGRHRIMKVLFEGKKTIKAVRFNKNPSPCEVLDK